MGGEGWSISSKKFDLESPHRKMFTVGYTISNPCGDSSEAEATPEGQLSEVFNELLEPAGTTCGDVIGIIEKQVPVKDISYFVLVEFRRSGIPPLVSTFDQQQPTWRVSLGRAHCGPRFSWPCACRSGNISVG